MNRKLCVHYTVALAGGHPRGAELMGATSQLPPDGSTKIVCHIFEAAAVVAPQVSIQDLMITQDAVHVLF